MGRIFDETFYDSGDARDGFDRSRMPELDYSREPDPGLMPNVPLNIPDKPAGYIPGMKIPVVDKPSRPPVVRDSWPTNGYLN